MGALRRSLAAVAVALLVAPAAVDAVPYVTADGRVIPIEYWAGHGDKQAVVVVDFSSGPDDSYAFGYRWVESATGEDALVAIDAAGDLDVTIKEFTGVGKFLHAMAYDGHMWENNWDEGHADWWSYWTDDFGEVETPQDLLDEGLSWHSPQEWGMSGRVLADRSFDGWAAAVLWDALPPEVPQSGWIPEPTTLVVLAAGLCALGARRRRPRR